MDPEVYYIFNKISEQLQDTSHPLAVICKHFQQEFIKDMDRQAGRLRTLI